ncbi:MAG: oligoendopeptidase F [Oscillospiraceae bacterium]|nr:oligoendopeptidase F [Oscillospiraceae bacterium]MBR2976769.1 oligoendopeptidase F [Oscillospiraceae bacterium]MBR3849232.1 oligoendopeptidase F [Oscillospiraceae bacterium]
MRERNEIELCYRWALEDLYVSDEAWGEDLGKLTALVESVPNYRGRLGESAATLLEYLRLNDEMEVLADSLGNYAARKADEDTRVSAGQALRGKLAALLTKAGELSDFEAPELLAIPDETLAAMFAEQPELEVYRRGLEKLRRRRAHILPPEGEKLLAAASELACVPEETFSLLNDADLTFPPAADSEGKEHPLTHGSFIPLMQSEDRTLRKNAFENLYGVYGAFRNTLAATLSGQMKRLWFYAKSRNYKDPLEKSLSANEVPVSVYDSLIETVNENMHLMGKYARLRKKLLGVDELRWYDLYAPLVEDAQKEIPYEEAVQTVLQALSPLGEDYAVTLKKGFSERWIDVYETPGKRSGAYSAGARVHPYVLLNYAGDLDGVFTLAHEMGHALHSHYSNLHQPICKADYVIFVAEVASTCNEALLMEHLLKTTKEPKQRALLINHFLEQFRATLYRQTMFAEFERTICRMQGAGEPLTPDALCGVYRELVVRYFGGEIAADDNIALEWARIPHFYYDFYVYQYATGYAAAIALSRRILSGEEGAVEDYLGFLRGGCSADPITLLRGAGVDMTSSEPVREALKLFDTLLDEMEELTKEIV